MPKADVVLEIDFDVNSPEKSVIRTNAKKEKLGETLEAWLSCQFGLGEDESELDKKDIYKIKIQLDLSDDSFYTNSDTGNKGLTCGIIICVLDNLSRIEVVDLS
ncbi:MAG: hypothetical protein HYY55_00635 [Candidatus Niyogibacteria bacterium]|nr:MAG: hypothetical protein HYY55_00635 [Candidatus Niyogibacteria bacterium]